MNRVIRSMIFLMVITGAMGASAETESRPTTNPYIVRQLKYPLKDRRTLFSDKEIAQLRENVARHPAARTLAGSILKVADEWAAWDDAKLIGLIPDARVPRAFDVSAAGCPKCGRAIYEKYGHPGWLVDPKLPFKVTCRVDGTVFPSNDFETYYRSGFKEKVGWDTEYVDDGWGWTDPRTGEKYWFVAHANHWILHGKLMHVLGFLSRGYLITGDRKYAHAALVLVHRYAEVYPAMDHAPQSRYGTMMRGLGQDYPGKIVNRIWETDMVTSLVEAYDACWDSIDADDALQKQTGKTGAEIRRFIEANLLEDAIEAYFQAKIRGNFGMHQGTLARLAIVRQYGEQDRWLDSLMNDAGGNPQLLGLNFALYNLIFRDGIPTETAVHYNSIWLERISQYAPLLEKSGRDPFAIPKVKRLYDGALAMICARAHNPNIGDGGTVWGGIIRPDLPSYQTAYRHYKDPRCGEYLAAYEATGEGSFKTFESLLYPPLETPASAANGPATLPAQPTRLLDGYGMGFLNNPPASTELALYYGWRAGHGHYDRLNIEVFASGHPILPDLGYPDGANEFVPGIFTWSKNTISHNTVTVDASRQHGNTPGVVELFADGKFARVIDVSATGTYSQCDQYRRAVVMVDCGSDESYFVDIFSVTGGRQHDYSLHGPPGTFEAIGGTWSEPQPGTLAGENVAVGQIYDDPKLGAPDYKGGYSGYTGSGFQHLYNVRRHQGGPTIGQWRHARDPTARLRIRVLDQPGQQLILANARVSPMKFPEVLTYVIARREGSKLNSRFVSVIEPYKSEPSIAHVKPVPLADGAGDATAVEVVHRDGTSDLILYDTAGSRKVTQDGVVSTDARAAVIRRDASGLLSSQFAVGGSYVEVNRRRTALAEITGSVLTTEPDKSLIRVAADQPDCAPERFIGRVVHFRNDLRQTAHTITAAARDGDAILLTVSDDLLVGRARVSGVQDQALITRTALPLAAIYRGVTLGSATMKPLGLVKEVNQGRIALAALLAPSSGVSVGDDVWLVNVGPGDRFVVPAMIDQ